LRVKIGDKLIAGVIIWTPNYHNQDQNVVKLKDLRIDIGATNKENVNGKVKRGDRIVFDSPFMEVGDTMLRGKAFDDRVGCSLLVDVLQGGPYPVVCWPSPCRKSACGATVAAQTLDPDVAFAFDVSPAHDVPDPMADPDAADEVNPGCRIGKGPVLTAMDKRLITPPRLLDFLRKTAEANGIPYQLKTAIGGGTDAGIMHKVGGGRPAASISMPCRYIHSPAAYLSKEDYASTLKLIQAALKAITFDVLKNA
jgi:endoglucanase